MSRCWNGIMIDNDMLPHVFKVISITYIHEQVALIIYDTMSVYINRQTLYFVQ